jgi:hypothetical protein
LHERSLVHRIAWIYGHLFANPKTIEKSPARSRNRGQAPRFESERVSFGRVSLHQSLQLSPFAAPAASRDEARPIGSRLIAPPARRPALTRGPFCRGNR